MYTFNAKLTLGGSLHVKDGMGYYFGEYGSYRLCLHDGSVHEITTIIRDGNYDCCPSIMVNRYVYLIGGVDQTPKFRHTAEYYEIKNNSFHSIDSLPIYTCGHSICNYHNQYLVVGPSGADS